MHKQKNFSLFAKCAGVIFLASVCSMSNADVIQVDYNTLSGSAFSDFEDLGLSTNESVNFDSIFESQNTSFGEYFTGQTVGTNGDFDTLSGLPSGTLQLNAGAPNQNINAIEGAGGIPNNTAISGLGPTGFPNSSSIGEGAISILFDFDQSEFGFEIIGANSGTAHIQFFTRNGSLFDDIMLDLGAGTSSWGFLTDDNSQAIAGVSITNIDAGGIGYDNFIYDTEGRPGTPGTPQPVNAPSMLLMLLASIGLLRAKSHV